MLRARNSEAMWPPPACRRSRAWGPRLVGAATMIDVIKDDLGYLKLDRAVEVFATLADGAAPDDHTRVPRRLVAEEAAATRNGGSPPGCATPDSRSGDHRRVRLRVPALRRPQARRGPRPLGSSKPARSCSSASPAAARPTSPSRSPSGPSRPATAATSPPPKTWSPTWPPPRDGTFASKLRTYTAPSVLVIDDVGLFPMDRGPGLRVLPGRQPPLRERHATIVTTNRGLPDWGEIFGDTVVAAAILDRLMHNAVVFNIKGPSWRLREHQALTQPLNISTSLRQPAPTTSRTCPADASLNATFDEQKALIFDERRQAR